MGFVDRVLEQNEDQENPTWQDGMRKLQGWVGWLLIGAIIIIYFLTGIYSIGPSEVGLLKRFGRYVETVDPGLHYHLPGPIESVVIVDTLGIRKEEIGFRTISPPPNPRYQEIETEALMLTGDGNIIHMEMVVQYRVKDPEQFAFNLINPRVITKQAAEAVLRRQVATRTVDEALTSQRDQIGMDTLIALQGLLDSYGAGIVISNAQLQDVKPPRSVVSAFDDVNSARQDKDKLINQGEEYALDILPRARGNAQQILNQALAYTQERIKRAEGEVSRFLEVLRKYELGEEVTRTRIYIETMEKILPGMEKIILPQQDNGIIKLLDLSRFPEGGE